MTPAERLHRLNDEAHALLFLTDGAVKDHIHNACRCLCLGLISARKQTERGTDGQSEKQ